MNYAYVTLATNIKYLHRALYLQTSLERVNSKYPLIILISEELLKYKLINDVKDEVELNASLNNLTNISTVVGNILDDTSLINDTFDWIFINIGGEETKMFMKFIKSHLNSNGKLLVS